MINNNIVSRAYWALNKLPGEPINPTIVHELIDALVTAKIEKEKAEELLNELYKGLLKNG